ncbi:MAG: alginate biosynthesis protein AlgK [Zoogloeaceae bacterium]|jgi:alginate biosynthesis protein AlgK|nr:alginate biosynthesis protein AlgK [Zoogloeaceae bacterium]
MPVSFGPRTLPILPALVMALAACTGLPDLRLAREALGRGDKATAESNLQQLADSGYIEAQLVLADLKLESGDSGQIREAEALYRRLVGQSPRAAARLGRLLASRPDASEADWREAAALLERAEASGEIGALLPLARLHVGHPQLFPENDIERRVAQWRAKGEPQADRAQIVLYRAQGSHLQHGDEIERICTAALAIDDTCYVDLLIVYRHGKQEDKQRALLERLENAVRAGALPPRRIETVAAVLLDPAFGPPVDAEAIRLLEQIAPLHPAAWITLARLLLDAPGQDEERDRRLLTYLDKGRAAGLPRADLMLGRLYLAGKRVMRDPFKAEQHLLAASAAGESSADFPIGRIYLRGFLGQVYPEKALRYLLASARGGNAKADLALAQMFSQGRGILPDPGNAFVFGQLAAQSGRPEDIEFAARLGQQLSPEQRAQAENMLRAERDYRNATSIAEMRAMTLQSH